MGIVFIFDLDDTLLNSNSYNTYNDIKIRKNLREILEIINNNPLYIYTNGTSGHALTSLKKMGILDLFDGIFARDTVPYMKPHYLSFKYVNNIIRRIHTNHEIIFFDDMNNNIDMAENFGWCSILISKQNNIYD